MRKEWQDRSKIEPAQLTRESKLTFRCHKNIACFIKCCSNIDIILTPYDILRMKTNLGITSEEFLDKYTLTPPLEKTVFPLVALKMQDDSERSCPFVSSNGCGIYANRPSTCRYYPIGFAAQEKSDAKEEFYFLVREEHCLGFEEKKNWTVQSWRENQECDLYDRMNGDWFEILIKIKSKGQLDASDKSFQLFFMVSYDLDRFRRFVFESTFLKKYDVSPDVMEKIKTDDLELMLFGLGWLKSVLWGEGKPNTK